MAEFDYIVCGGGSAGSVLAGKLSEMPNTSVLLIEAGRRDRNPWIHIPATFFKVLKGGKDSVIYQSEPEPQLGNRPWLVPQGKVLGGGSSVNAMLYVRGQADDYNVWAQSGCTGWGYDDVLPTFREMEGNTRIDDDLHGTDGPLTVSDTRSRHPLFHAFLRAAEQAGLPRTDDFNGARQDGMGFYQTTARNGRRHSAVRAFLRPAAGRTSLTVMTETRIDRVQIEQGRATGVVLTDGRTLTARYEVILTAGALMTPLILMRSGIGPAEHLNDHGIPVLADMPGVGQNFQDHAAVPIEALTREPISLYGQDAPLRGALHLAQWALTRRGLLTSNVIECGGFIDTAGRGRPDIQFHMTPSFGAAPGRPPQEGHGISFSACVLRPQSRGSVRLSSADASAPGLFHSGVLTDPSDIDATLRGLRLGLKILEQPALAEILGPRQIPVAGADDEAGLIAHIRARAKTVYHPAGTARMGATDDPDSVVDPRLRVKGVAGLRVADASIMPRLVSGNTNAPTMMCAARAAAFIKDERGARTTRKVKLD